MNLDQPDRDFSPARLSAAHVLIATDLGRDDLAELARRLAIEGATLEPARCVPEALDIASTLALDLALVDADLPETGGLTLCRQLARHAHGPVPTMLRLGKLHPVEFEEALAAGVLHCLPGTTSPDQLHLILRNQLKALLRRNNPDNHPEADKAMLAALPGAAFLTNAEFRLADANSAVTELAAASRSELLQLTLPDLFARCQFGHEASRVIDRLSASGLWQGELHGHDNTGNPRVYWLHARQIRADAPDTDNQRYLFILSDIAHRKIREQRLRVLAETDALTGIANRNQFLSRFEDAIARAAAGGQSPALLFLDLDGFKAVNDHFGHGMGDEVLRQVADILQSCVRADDLVARHGGDEFVVMLLGSTYPVLEETSRRILERLSLLLTHENGNRIEVTCSIGIAMHPSDGDNPAELLKRADKAMYTVKRQGKRGYRFATPPALADLPGALHGH